jgi:hypothetical protein
MAWEQRGNNRYYDTGHRVNGATFGEHAIRDRPRLLYHLKWKNRGQGCWLYLSRAARSEVLM